MSTSSIRHLWQPCPLIHNALIISQRRLPPLLDFSFPPHKATFSLLRTTIYEYYVVYNVESRSSIGSIRERERRSLNCTSSWVVYRSRYSISSKTCPSFVWKCFAAANENRKGAPLSGLWLFWRVTGWNVAVPIGMLWESRSLSWGYTGDYLHRS